MSRELEAQAPKARRAAEQEGRNDAGESGLHNAFTNDLFSRLSKPAQNDQFQARPEYKNGLASESLMDLEKWTKDGLTCGKVDQEQLAEKISEFAKKTDAMWDKMENSGNSKDFVRMSEDEFTTTKRFNNVFDQLDDQHRDKVLESLPWRLRPGE